MNGKSYKQAEFGQSMKVRLRISAGTGYENALEACLHFYYAEAS
jgi:hypothetical protein